MPGLVHCRTWPSHLECLCQIPFRTYTLVTHSSKWILRIRQRQQPSKPPSLLSVFCLVLQDSESYRNTERTLDVQILSLVIVCKSGDLQMFCSLLKARAARQILVKISVLMALFAKMFLLPVHLFSSCIYSVFTRCPVPFVCLMPSFIPPWVKCSCIISIQEPVLSTTAFFLWVWSIKCFYEMSFTPVELIFFFRRHFSIAKLHHGVTFFWSSWLLFAALFISL